MAIYHVMKIGNLPFFITGLMCPLARRAVGLPPSAYGKKCLEVKSVAVLFSVRFSCVTPKTIMATFQTRHPPLLFDSP